MPAFTGMSELTGFTYEIYDKLVNLIPGSAKAVRMIAYQGADKELGNKFHQNVIVSEEGGFTHSAPGVGAFTVNGAISLTTQDAQVDGYQLVLQSSLSYEAAAKASASRKAYAAIAETKLRNMVESTRRRQEVQLWYGQAGLGKIGTSTNQSTVKTRLNMLASTFAPLIWGGKKGFEIVFYNGSTLVSSGADSVFTIDSVDIANRYVFVTGTTTGITALDAAVSGAPNVVDAFFRTSKQGTGGGVVLHDMVGIDIISANTGSLFNIDASIYDLFAGNTYNVGSVALTLAKVISAATAGVNRGLDEDVVLWVHPQTWTNLSSNEAALRRYGAEVKTASNGWKSIEFAHMNGTISVMGHGFIKEGVAYMLPMRYFKRVGAQDVSFKTPGRNPNDDIFWHDPSVAGFSYRLYTHQSVFCERPAYCVKLTNIVNA